MRPYDLAKSLFLQALDVPAGERAAFLDGECHGDDALRAEVESLLAFHDHALAGLGSPAPEALPERIADYQVLGELGRGGMGIVLLARRGEELPVAIKLLRPGLLSPELLQRFRREAVVLARLDHPGIARLLQTGIEDGPAGQRPWLAMQRVEGSDLRAWARAERAPAERLELMARVCDAVQHAHAHGVVHRDLKPENILVQPTGEPVVLDFGVARLADSDLRATTVLTSVGVLVGTIRYMSPEQAEARPEGIDARSDVHALGVLTYELLTGRLPFNVPENSVHRALVAVMTAPPRPMHELPAPLRGALERVLSAALAKDPRQRTASAAGLGEDLRRVAAGRRPLARVVRTHRGVAAAGPRRWLALASAAALVGIVLSSWRSTPSPADWAQGALRPAVMYAHVITALDSASVRLHYTTRTLAREREALAWAQRARALLRTIGWQSYAARVERLALFREGEARYLIAERTNDVAQFEAASKLWYLSRETRFPVPSVALPQSASLASDELGEPVTPAPWLSASMALVDAARLAAPEEHDARALEIAREGARAYDDILRTMPATDALGRRAQARQRTYVEARLGAALVGHGVHGDRPAELAEGIVHLRTAVRLAAELEDAPAFASHLHELGCGEARAAAAGGGPALLDSALAHLERAYVIRSGLDGYTSRYLSRLELAQAHRLAARRRAAPGEPARHLAAAAELLALAPADRAALGSLDRALYDVAGAALRVDECCVARDTSGLGPAQRALASVLDAPGTRRTPTVQVDALLEAARIDALRYALGHDVRLLRRTNQTLDFALLRLRGSNSAREQVRVHVAKLAIEAPPRAFALEWPLPEPY